MFSVVAGLTHRDSVIGVEAKRRGLRPQFYMVGDQRPFNRTAKAARVAVAFEDRLTPDFVLPRLTTGCILIPLGYASASNRAEFPSALSNVSAIGLKCLSALKARSRLIDRGSCNLARERAEFPLPFVNHAEPNTKYSAAHKARSLLGLTAAPVQASAPFGAALRLPRRMRHAERITTPQAFPCQVIRWEIALSGAVHGLLTRVIGEKDRPAAGACPLTKPLVSFLAMGERAGAGTKPSGLAGRDQAASECLSALNTGKLVGHRKVLSFGVTPPDVDASRGSFCKRGANLAIIQPLARLED
jgi:hypothetical protein